jgi:hypothetical protein
MCYAKVRPIASALVVLTLLLAGCSRNADPQTVAEQFVRAYFVEDNMAAAVKLASGSARAKLEKDLQEIKGVGAREPAADKPRVTLVLLETRPVPGDEMQYVYRIASDVEVEGMQPITARLWLHKQGNVWQVSKFVQEE